MKKAFLTALLLGTFCLPAWAQRPVSHAVQNRKVVLEQFTHIHCSTCPNAHRIADSLRAAKPAGSMFVVNIHAGTAPYFGQPDFRNTDGDAIAGLPGMNLLYYPSGAVNRQRFGSTSSWAVAPYQWGAFVDSVQSQPASHNIALDGLLNVTTRFLTVQTEVWGQTNYPNVFSGRYLTVMILEDSVSGPQSGGNLYYPAQIEPADSSYKHNYMLRKVLSYSYYPNGYTYPSGSSTSQGFSYTIPTYYGSSPVVLGNLRVLAFLSEADSSIITATTGPIVFTNYPGGTDLQIMPDVQVDKDVCAALLKPVIRLYNNGGSTISGAVLQASINGMLPVNINFNRSLGPARSALFKMPALGFVPDSSNTLKVKILTVDGFPDSNPEGDSLVVSNILKTSRKVSGKYVVMRFTQDRYGAESAWKIVEEATGTVKLAGGPYPNLATNGTALHADSFMAKKETCYEVLAFDAVGNGINNSSGTGHFEVTSNGQVIYTSNGTYGSRDRAVFKTAENLAELPQAITGLSVFENSVSLLPNPTSGETNLIFSLSKGTSILVQVTDMTGRVVAHITAQNLAAGTHLQPISTAGLAGGVYNIRLATAEGVVTQRLVVVK